MASAQSFLSGVSFEFINCDSGATGYRNEYYGYKLTQTTDLNTIRTGGATNGVTPTSWRVAVPSIGTFIFSGLSVAIPPIYKWNTTLSSITATIEFLCPAAQLNNNDIWVELEYMGSGSTPVGSYITSLPTTPLTAAGAVTSSTALWTSVWNTDDLLNVTLSAGNLTATKSSASAGAVRSIMSTSTGLYYFEITDVTTSTTWKCGMADSTYVESAALGVTTHSFAYTPNDGTIKINNSTIATIQTATSADIIGIAIDFTHSKVWIRKNGGNWNNDVIGNQNPATNTGGVSTSTLAAGTYFVAFGDSANGTAAATANFGATTFNTTAPSGFSAWNAITIGQKLQVTFAPAIAGFIQATVMCFKSSTTLYIDPLLTLA